MTSASRILVARTDRLGDVMMTLPTLEYLRRSLPDSSLDFYCRPELHDLLRPFLKARRIGLVSEPEWKVYDSALFLFAEPRDFFRAWKSGVKVRGGVKSKWPSWLWLNHGVRQSRSAGGQSEAVYNLEAAEALVRVLKGSAPPAGKFRLQIEGDAASEEEAGSALTKAGIEEPFLVVHPGMGGSALNLTAEGYARLVALWPKTAVVLSAGPSPQDAPLVEALLGKIPRSHRLPPVSLSALREVFRQAELVLAPSTGPLHLAHYVGTNTLGIFSSLPSQKPERWAPWGGAGLSQVLSPDHSSPGIQVLREGETGLEVRIQEGLPRSWADGLMRES